jgi:hypothetical protein
VLRGKLVRSNGYQRRRALVEYKSETIKGIVYVMLPVYAGGYSITYDQRPIIGAMTFGAWKVPNAESMTLP